MKVMRRVLRTLGVFACALGLLASRTSPANAASCFSTYCISVGSSVCSSTAFTLHLACSLVGGKLSECFSYTPDSCNSTHLHGTWLINGNKQTSFECFFTETYQTGTQVGFILTVTSPQEFKCAGATGATSPTCLKITCPEATCPLAGPGSKLSGLVLITCVAGTSSGADTEDAVAASGNTNINFESAGPFVPEVDSQESAAPIALVLGALALVAERRSRTLSAK